MAANSPFTICNQTATFVPYGDFKTANAGVTHVNTPNPTPNPAPST